MIDKQSAVIAMKFFSQDVQYRMVEIEELKEYVESQKEPKERQNFLLCKMHTGVVRDL